MKRSLNQVARMIVHAVTILALVSPNAAEAGEVPPDRQVLILTRALAYDGNLKTRAGPEIVIAIVGKAGNAGSEETAEALSNAFRTLGSVKVQGLPLKAVRVSWSGAAPLSAAIKAQGVDAVYIAAGLEAELGSILNVAKQNQIISMGSREEHVSKGASLGVFLVDSKPTIFVNLAASKGEGAAFSSDLLRLAKVIR